MCLDSSASGMAISSFCTRISGGMRGCKVPDAADAARHHRVAHGLGARRGHGDDAQLNVMRAAPAGQLDGAEHRLVADLRAHERRVLVERRNDLHAVGREARIRQQRAAQMPCAGKHGLARLRIAEIVLDVDDEIIQQIADLRPAADGADRCKVLAHEHGVEVHFSRDVVAGYRPAALLLQPLEELKVGGQPLKGRIWYRNV